MCIRDRYEAAAIDGAGQLKIFVKIMLPAAMTMMVTVFLFMFVWQYNDSYYTNMLVGNFKTMTSELSRAASDFRLGIFLNSIIPVSYTHLDVYKRQHLPCAKSICPAKTCSFSSW